MAGSGQVLLVMPHIETPCVYTINCNTIDTQTLSENNNSEMGKTEDEHQYTNNTQETGKCNINTSGVLNSNNGDKPMISDNINSKLNCFLPSPQQEADEKAGTEIM